MIAITVMVLSISTQSMLDLNFKQITLKAYAKDAPTPCKWKRLDCSGWGTGSYEACLTIGDGRSCSCGDVTRDCIK